MSCHCSCWIILILICIIKYYNVCLLSIMPLMTHLTAHPWIFSLESMLAVVNRSLTGLAYSVTVLQERSCHCHACSLFHFLVANCKIPPDSPSESGSLVCLAGDAADNDMGIPFRIAGDGYPRIILRYLFFFFRFYDFWRSMETAFDL